MCNLYSVRKGQAEIRTWFRATRDQAGNLPLLSAVFPDALAPTIRLAEGRRQLEAMRWGMPGPAQFGGAPVTNIRNTQSPHWRAWLSPASRCLVPATAFCEYEATKPRKTPVWFALNEDRPLFAFAGLWTRWSGVRGPKSRPTTGEHRLFGFLTCAANAVVAPIHPKAMPVVLTEEEEWDVWLRAPWGEASRLQQPLDESALRIVARGEKEDPPGTAQSDAPRFF